MFPRCPVSQRVRVGERIMIGLAPTMGFSGENGEGGKSGWERLRENLLGDRMEAPLQDRVPGELILHSGLSSRFPTAKVPTW